MDNVQDVGGQAAWHQCGVMTARTSPAPGPPPDVAVQAHVSRWPGESVDCLGGGPLGRDASDR